jgi:hypothetical protein
MKSILLASVVAGAATCMFPTMSFAGTVPAEQFANWTGGRLHLPHDAFASVHGRKVVHAHPRQAPSCWCEPSGQAGLDPRGRWEDYPGWRWNGDPSWQWDGYPRWLWHG